MLIALYELVKPNQKTFAARCLMLLLTLASLSGLEARAGKQHVVFVGGEDKNGWTSVSVITSDSGELVALDVDGDRYSLATIRRGSAIRIDGIEADQDVVRLSGNALNPSAGGTLTLSYLHNGMSDNWNSYTMDVRREGTTWKLYPRGGDRELRSFYFTKKTFIGATIGIDEINPRLAPPQAPGPTLLLAEPSASENDENPLRDPAALAIVPEGSGLEAGVPN